MTDKRLPKQWAHWCRMARISVHRKYKTMRGRNRVWRVNRDGNFECSCPLERFDRWANSRGAEMQGVPRTEKEFLATVLDLHKRSMEAD